MTLVNVVSLITEFIEVKQVGAW